MEEGEHPMTRAATALLLILAHASLTAGSHDAPVRAAVSRAEAASDHRVIVLLKRPQGTAIRMKHATTAIIDRNASQIYAKWRVVPGFAATVDDAELERLRTDPNVISVEPDRTSEPLEREVEETAFTGQIGLNADLIGLPAVHALGYDGAGSTVAVLGTGVSPHPDVKDRVIEERCYCAYLDGKGCCPNGSTAQFGAGSALDTYPHETSVAAVIAGSGGIAPRGIAPAANIIAIRVGDGTANTASMSQLISALDWIAASPLRIDAINMSFNVGFLSAGPCDQSNLALADALARVRRRGTVLVASSGNDAAANGMRPPACISTVFSVGAVYHRNLTSASLGCTDAPAEVDRVTCFSNSSNQLGLLAPGFGVATAYKNGVANVSGTSFSAPHVAGAVAILRQVDPELSPDAIEQLLRSTGRPILDSRNGFATPRLDLFPAVMVARLHGNSSRTRPVRP